MREIFYSTFVFCIAPKNQNPEGKDPAPFTTNPHWGKKSVHALEGNTCKTVKGLVFCVREWYNKCRVSNL